jgi:hypothetical protein
VISPFLEGQGYQSVYNIFSAIWGIVRAYIRYCELAPISFRFARGNPRQVFSRFALSAGGTPALPSRLILGLGDL